MSDERIDIQNLLQAGSFTTARSRSQDSDWREPEPLEREPRFYSGTTGNVETVHASDARGRTLCRPTTPPPPPTVEDGDDDDVEFAHEKPKCRGDSDQLPVLIDNENYVNYAEQRFVLVSNPGEKAEGQDGHPKRNGRAEREGVRVDEPADRGRQAEKAPGVTPRTPPRKVAAPAVADAEALSAAAAAAAAGATASGGPRRRPSASTHSRRRSRADLPRIDTDMYGPRGEDPKHNRSRSSAPTYETDYRYNAPRSPDRPSRSARDNFLSPEVIKSGRNREESSYYGASRGPRTSRQGERPSSSSNRRRDDAYYNTGYLETPVTGSRTRLEPELRSTRGSRRSSPRAREDGVVVPDTGLEDLSAFYPDLSRGAASPPRKRDPRTRRYTNQYSGDESDTSSVRRSGRRPVVIQTDGRSTKTVTPDDIRYSDARSRPVTGTISSKQNGYRDNGPRGPRSPTTTAQPLDPPATPPYPVEDMMPSQDRPGYLEPEYWGPNSGPRGPQGPTTMPIRVPAPSGPRGSRPGSRGQGTSRAWQPSPPKPKGIWQDNASATGYLPPGPRQAGISVRRYFEDPRRLELPKVPKCPRKEPVAGMTDWLTLADDDDLFTICPTCYTDVFSKSHFRPYFKPLVQKHPDMKYFCDFGSSPWYVVAWLVSLKNGIRDHRLFLDISRVMTDHAKSRDNCPGNRRAFGLWHSVRDPATGHALPSFDVCGECVKIVSVLMPNLKGALATPGTDGKSVCSLHCGSDMGAFLLYFDVLERASDEAPEGTAVSEGRLAADLAAVARPTSCPRDGLIFDEKWYFIPWLPELSVCAACYEDVACPVLKESARSEERFGMRAGRLREGTCQLYSERMRNVFKEACRMDDQRMLEDAALERRAKEEDIKRTVDRLKRIGDPLAVAEIQRLEEVWKTWE